MFDVSFSELTVVGAVALIVLGPEKLPKIAKSAGEWVGKEQRYVNDVKGQINREIEQSQLNELKNMRDSLQTAASDFQSGIHKDLSSLENDLVPPLQVDLPDDPYGYGSTPTIHKTWRPRKKKLSHRRVAMPHWYKQLHGQRTRLLSGAARMQRHKK